MIFLVLVYIKERTMFLINKYNEIGFLSIQAFP